MKSTITIVLAFLIISTTSCSTSRSTNYAKLPKQIQNQIELNFDKRNVFFYRINDDPGEFLIWFYSNSTVIWKSFNHGNLQGQGMFKSHKNLDNLNIYQTNQMLEKELDLLEKSPDCKMVLDGENFGYVIQIDNRTSIGLNAINSSECFKQNENNFISEDFKIVRNLTYSFN